MLNNYVKIADKLSISNTKEKRNGKQQIYHYFEGYQHHAERRISYQRQTGNF